MPLWTLGLGAPSSCPPVSNHGKYVQAPPTSWSGERGVWGRVAGEGRGVQLLTGATGRATWVRKEGKGQVQPEQRPRGPTGGWVGVCVTGGRLCASQQGRWGKVIFKNS